jgi:hypothetical protein
MSLLILSVSRPMIVSKAIVVTGHGHTFCAGADLNEGLGKGS